VTNPDSGFVLDLFSTNGPVLVQLPEHEGGLALREHTTWLRIRSDITGFVPPTLDPEDDELTGFVPPVFERDGLALLVNVRDHADLSGRSVGLFHARLTAEELDQLRAAIEGTPWAELPRPIGGDFNAPKLSLAYERGNVLIRRSFNARSSNFIEAITPVWRLIDRYLVRARKSPATTLELTVDAAARDDEDPSADPLALTLDLTLRVRGIGHAVVTDPRLPAREGDPPRLRVRIGELVSPNPHARPRGWVELDIPPPPAGAPSTRVLRPHARVRTSLSWVAPRPGRYLVEASWQDYRGPLESVPGQTPLMPLPAHGPSSLGSGPYPIRGAVFARREIELGSSEP
jgi:hypothetical protein